MNQRFHSLLVVVIVFAAAASLSSTRAAAQGFDRVRVGTTVEVGNIKGMDELKVKLSKGVLEKEIQVNEITDIAFAREPVDLPIARNNAASGGYQNALKALARIDLQDVRRDEIKQDIEFYKVFCKSKLAITGEGDLREVGLELLNFVRENKQNFHYYQAVETLGDLLVAMGRFDKAQEQYAILAAAPWDDFKLRANVLEGRALVAQNKHSDAIQRFDDALAMEADTPSAKELHLAATLGKATSLAETGQVDQAIKMVYDVIATAEPEAADLHARAYNALGHCYLKGTQQKDALLAFLHVDVLYSGYPAAHAEALYYLAPLWEAIGQGERARKARELLAERYPNSRWTTLLAKEKG